MENDIIEYCCFRGQWGKRSWPELSRYKFFTLSCAEKKFTHILLLFIVPYLVYNIWPINFNIWNPAGYWKCLYIHPKPSIYFDMLINDSTQFFLFVLEETGVKGLGKTYPGSAASIYVCHLFFQQSSWL